jgi:membrane protease YdiL (CAAX protease family)
VQLPASPKGSGITRQIRGDGIPAFFTVACLATWVLATPVALAWMHHAAPMPAAVACAGLSAFGPLLAALAIAGPRGELGRVFGRWRANPAWVVAALFAPMTVHLVAIALFVATGGTPDRWVHTPSTPEQWAALMVFPLGEEFGWRGFAQPRMAERFGLVRGTLLLGALWGLWHLAYSITPEAGRFDALTFALTMAELPLYALLIAWVFERANRSMAVAIAFHAGAHLDHIELAPRTDLRLPVIHLLVVAVVATLAARSLGARNAGAAPGACAG